MIHPSCTRSALLIATAPYPPQTAAAHPDPAEFEKADFIKEPATVDCTLTDGTATACRKIAVGQLPADPVISDRPTDPGTTSPAAVHHDHAATEFPKLPTGLVDVLAEGNFATAASAGIGSARSGGGGRYRPLPRGRGGPGRTHECFGDAAATPGLSTEALNQALHSSGQGRPDLAAAAIVPGGTGEVLRAVLLPPARQ